MNRLIEESGEQRKFRHLPEMCYASPCQLGALTSESFSERIIIAVNLLVNTYRIRLDQGNTDNMIDLRTSKRLMERVRTKIVV